jgi:hypothetical protein
MIGWRNESRVAIDFAALPPAAQNPGRAIRCNPLVVGQPYFWMESDGEFWRPLGGAQVLYSLNADIQMPASPTSDWVECVSIPIPPMMFPDSRLALRTIIGIDKVGTADILNVYQKFSASETAPNLFQSTLSMTAVSGGMTNQASRETSTTFRKHGAAGAATNAALSVVSVTARMAAVTVQDLDTQTNYFSVWGRLTTGGLGDYGILHEFNMEIVG